MLPLYYKQIINNLSAAITKKYNNKRRSRKSLVCSHRTLWKTLHSFIFLSHFVVFMTDQCDQCNSVKEENNFLFVLIGSLEYFLHVGAKPEQILQSCLVVVRYAEELDTALAIYIQCLWSCNRGVSEDQSINTIAEGGALQHPLATVRIKTMFRNVQFLLVLSLNSGKILDKAFSLHYCLIQNCS